jgi:hypothetical protein
LSVVWVVPPLAANVSICVRAGLPKPRGVPDTERTKDTKTLDYASTPLDANTLLPAVCVKRYFYFGLVSSPPLLFFDASGLHIIYCFMSVVFKLMTFQMKRKTTLIQGFKNVSAKIIQVNVLLLSKSLRITSPITKSQNKIVVALISEFRSFKVERSSMGNV